MARRRRVPPREQGPATGEPSAPARARRLLIALSVVCAVGFGVGAAVAMWVPSSAFVAEDRARAALLEDTAISLEQAAALADGGDAALWAIGALARMLLSIDHAGGSADRSRAEALLQSTLSFVPTAPEALLARALLKRTGGEDASLDEDIAKKTDKSKNPSALLARASRAVSEGRHVEAQALLYKAALAPDAPLRAQTELARFLVTRGELDDARAIAERARRRSQKHAASRIIGILAAVLDDVRQGTAEERVVKREKRRAKGPRQRAPRGLSRDDDIWCTPEEDEAMHALDGINERDRALLALFLQVLAAARGDDELAASLRTRVVPMAKNYPALAARQIELSLLDGDLATAEELLAAVDNDDEPALALHQARLAALKLIADDELRKRAGGSRGLAPTGVILPFGELAFDAWASDIPLVARFDPAFVPEATLIAAVRSGVTGPALELKLANAVLVHKGETALARGDVVTAAMAAAQANERANGDPDVLLLAARIRLRQGDRDAAREAIDAAITVAPDDPHVLFVAARLHYDNEGFIPAHKALQRLLALGFKSPQALALDAMLDARAGDASTAARTLAEARDIGADSAAVLHATVLILRAGRDMKAAREAANRLHDIDQLRTTDPILRAWEADAVARAGERGRALAILDELIAQRNLGDADFFRAEIDGDREGYAKAAELVPGTVIAFEARKKVPAKNKRKNKPR